MACLYRGQTNTATNGARASISKSILLLFSTIFLVSFPAWSFAGGRVSEHVRFSLDFQNERLGSVCEKISQATGYEILIDPKWEEISVSGSLKSVSVQEGLMKILNKYNTVICVDDGAKKCEVVILEGPGTVAEIPPVARDKILVAKSKTYSADQAVVFPGKEGERGITVKELEAIIARQSAKDNGDLEVVPSNEPGKKGTTKRELEAIMVRHSAGGNGDLEVISPPEPGKTGITKRELETRVKPYSSAGPETPANFLPFLQKAIDGKGKEER